MTKQLHMRVILEAKDGFRFGTMIPHTDAFIGREIIFQYEICKVVDLLPGAFFA